MLQLHREKLRFEKNSTTVCNTATNFHFTPTVQTEIKNLKVSVIINSTTVYYTAAHFHCAATVVAIERNKRIF